MKVFKEVNSYSDFDFWSGARDTVKYLTAEEIEEIFSMLEDAYPEGMEETEVNDFFWFEDDTIAEWLGYSSHIRFDIAVFIRHLGKRCQHIQYRNCVCRLS